MEKCFRIQGRACACPPGQAGGWNSERVQVEAPGAGRTCFEGYDDGVCGPGVDLGVGDAASAVNQLEGAAMGLGCGAEGEKD